jgi:hypothetical protein
MNERDLIVAASAFLGARGVNFLDKALEPLATEVGQDVLAIYHRLRGARSAKVVDQAAAMLDEVEEQPGLIPGRILFPALSYSSVEEDDDLQRKWAALLANAASSTDANKILPAYAELLRQLTPIQAHILDYVFDLARDSTIGFLKWPDVPRKDIETRFSLFPGDYALFISDMDRLQIIEGRRDTNIPPHLAMSREQMQDLVVGRWDTREKYNFVSLTTLGVGFMFACTSPKKAAEINARVRSR